MNATKWTVKALTSNGYRTTHQLSVYFTVDGLCFADSAELGCGRSTLARDGGAESAIRTLLQSNGQTLISATKIASPASRG